MTRAMTRADRLQEMERLYIQRCYSDIEMADRLSVNRSTVYKDRMALGDKKGLIFQQDEQGRYCLDRKQYISPVRLKLIEALALYLAARRSSRQTQPLGDHAANALGRLATALQQPMTEQLVRAAETILAQKRADKSQKNMETITTAWVERLKVTIRYQALDAERPKTHTIEPYLIEPSHWSDSIYVIGRSNLNGAIIPFKTERILSAILGRETFEPPQGFDDQTLLRHAWGVWYADRDPVCVRLRFAPGRAARRLKESVWHPLEKVEDTADGGCIWACEVVEWQEMVPWVRGWGADVEVQEPKVLRREIEREVMRLAELYQLSVSEDDIPEEDDDAWAARLFGAGS